MEQPRAMPKCHECGTIIGEPSEFYYCPACGDSLCPQCRMGHAHAD